MSWFVRPLRRVAVLWASTAIASALLLSAQVPVAAAEADPALELPAVSVQGHTAVATDPVSGFVPPTTITGSKTDTPLREQAQSISVVTRDEMDARQSQSVGDALRYTAGVRVEPYGPDTRYDWFYLRGFAAESNAVFLNGLRYHFGSLAGIIEPYGLERIEVVRGPASVLYGQIGPGGIVNLVSRHPTEDPRGEIRLTGGSYGTAQAAFNSSGKLTEDGKWSYSVTGLERSAGTQVDFVKNDRTFIAPAVTYRPDADSRLTLLSYYQHDQTQGDEFLPAIGTLTDSAFGKIPTSRFTGSKEGDRFNRVQYGVGYEAEHRFSDVFILRQNARFSHVDYDWQQHYGIGTVAGSNDRLLQRYPYRQNVTAEAFQVDTQGETRFATGPVDHTVLTGIDYAYSLNTNRFAPGALDTIDLYNPVYKTTTPVFKQNSNTRQLTNQLGAYAQDQLKLGKFVLSGGMRYDWAGTGTLQRTTSSRANQDDTALTGRVGLVYLMDNGLAPYASYSTSFSPQIGLGFYGQTYKPTTGKQVEVGIKYQPPSRQSYVQAAVFELTQNNVLTTDPANALNSVQTGAIRVRGIELEGVGKITDGLNVHAQYTLLDPIITKSTIAAELGQRPNGVPMTTAGSYADYTFDPEVGPLKGLSLGGGVRFTGNVPAGNTHVATVPSVTVFDASLRYSLAGLKLGKNFNRTSFEVNASNIFDRTYVASCGSTSSCFYGLRRTVLGSMIYKW